MRLTADNQYRWQDTLLEAVRIGGVLAGLVLLSACSMSGTSQASHTVSVDAARVVRPFGGGDEQLAAGGERDR